MTDYLVKYTNRWLFLQLTREQCHRQIHTLTLVFAIGLSSASLIAAWILYNHR